MVKVSNRQYAEALYEITRDLSGVDLTDAIKTFVELLVRNHKFKQADNIIIEFERYSKKQDGVVELQITSARKLDKTTIDQIRNIFGKHVEENNQVDESIIGGVKIKMEDKILDASLKTQLHSLKQSLVNN